MNIANLSQLFLFFLTYSFLGWAVETICFSVREKRFVKRSMLLGPICPAYGMGSLMILLLSNMMARTPLSVFTISVFTTALLAGCFRMAREMTDKDQQQEPHRQISGPVLFAIMFSCGLVGLMLCYGIHPALFRLLNRIPVLVQGQFAAFLVVLFALDLFWLVFTVTGQREKLHRYRTLWRDLNALDKTHAWYDRTNLHESVHRLRALSEEHPQDHDLRSAFLRLDDLLMSKDKGYPVFKATLQPEFAGAGGGAMDASGVAQLPQSHIQSRAAVPPAEKALSVKDLSFTTIVFIFTFGCVFGFIFESIFCLLNQGVFESRKGMLYGPFSQVYGFGAVAMTVCLLPLAKHGNGWLFAGGALMGGVVEFICSWFQEKAFGTVSWEYSTQPFSIQGRTNLQLMLVWGIIAMAYIRWFFPAIKGILDRIPRKPAVVMARVCAIGLSMNMLLSAAAVTRWQDRLAGAPPRNAYESFMDEHYPDERLERIYANMRPAPDRTSDTAQ